jgi:nitrogen regulation protein NR(I)
MKHNILIVEDDSSLADSIRHVLSLAGYGVTVTATGESGRACTTERRFAAILTDFRLPGLSGLDLVKEIRSADSRVPIILMTGHGTAELAIEATKWGAYDYLLKPFEMSALLAMLENAVAHYCALDEPAERVKAQLPPNLLIGDSRPMQFVYKTVGRVAATPASVMIQGESGTGKELVARAIWQHSRRASKPFVAVNCTAIPEALVESEMFGHERGAFTGANTLHIGRFEQADGGTIFLDEVGDMPWQTQAKLLRVLQEKTIQRVGGRDPIPIDVRIISATHRDLAVAIQENRFREDLFYRLNVVSVTLPPLRERPEDIPDLVRYFVCRQSAKLGVETPPIRGEAIEFLQKQPWPGNIRELESVVCRALLIRPGLLITCADVRSVLVTNPASGDNGKESISTLVKKYLANAAHRESTGVYGELVGVLERELFQEAIKLSKGNQVRAARWLGISRLTLRQRLRTLGLAGSSQSG